MKEKVQTIKRVLDDPNFAAVMIKEKVDAPYKAGHLSCVNMLFHLTEDLSVREEKLVRQHLESCDSCRKIEELCREILSADTQ